VGLAAGSPGNGPAFGRVRGPGPRLAGGRGAASGHRRHTPRLSRSRTAATLHASAPAIQYYVQACEQLATATGGGEQPDPARLHERLGDLRLLEGEYEAARQNFARARAFGGSAEDLASLWVKEGTAWEKSADYDRALASFNRAEAAIESGTAVEAGARRALIAAIALRRGDVQFLRGDHADALDSATLALRLLGEDAEHADIARAHSLIGRVACVQGAYDSAEERHGRALTIFERSRLWTWPVGMVSTVRKDWRLSWPAGRT
jgi:tetratricopeptide (TPR) repeat protein